MNKKPWYIWLSLIAFVILWVDTGRRFFFLKGLINNTKAFNSWMNALGQMFISVIGFIIIPIILMGIIFGFLSQIFPNNFILFDIIQISVLYLLGVYISYKHVIWRKNNL